MANSGSDLIPNLGSAFVIKSDKNGWYSMDTTGNSTKGAFGTATSMNLTSNLN